jgi:hypothetical protein
MDAYGYILLALALAGVIGFVAIWVALRERAAIRRRHQELIERDRYQRFRGQVLYPMGDRNPQPVVRQPWSGL